MARFENTFGITDIILKPTAKNVFCPIGQQEYIANIIIYLYKVNTIPDYIEVETWINENISNNELTIEEVADKVKNYFVEEYCQDYQVDVEVKVDDAAHFPVEVSIKNSISYR